MSNIGSAICLTPIEIKTLNTVADHSHVSSEIIEDKTALIGLEAKGFIEKIHQDAAGIDRYRLTIDGRIRHRNIRIMHI